NNLKDINEYIGKLKNLEEFYFSSKYTIKATDNFYSLEKLKKLYIEGDFSYIKNEIHRLKNIEYLYLSNND
ncbi:leucine-rich repeat domain-containing protein, partial [Brachyspira intermedia]